VPGQAIKEFTFQSWKVYQKFASEEVLCYYELLKDNRQTDILAANAAE
jgi:hypothetical protein